MMEQDDPSDPVLSAVASLRLPRGARILVAVSGGPDSVALLDALTRLAPDADRGWDLQIGHVNHALRGQDSDADESFVVEMAHRLALPCRVARVDTRQRAAERHLSIETAARELRREALQDMLVSRGGDLIALAHTADDQAETLLLRLLRGTGLDGMAGMSERSGVFVRPLLRVRRGDVLRYLETRGLPYRFDASNLDTSYSRNRVRHELVPAMERFQPRAVASLARAARVLGADADLLRLESGEALELMGWERLEEEARASAAIWKILHPALQLHVLRRLLEQVLGDLHDVEERHVIALARALQGEQGPARIAALPRTVAFERRRIDFALRLKPIARPPLPPRDLPVPGESWWNGYAVKAELLESLDREDLARLVTVCGPFHALCDAAAIGSHLAIRTRRPGDRVKPLGMAGSRKLQDIMVDRKIPRATRDTIPVLDNGRHVVWVPGIVLDTRAAVSGTSTRVAHLSIRPSEGGAVLEYGCHFAR